MILKQLPLILKYENDILSLEINVTSMNELCITYRSVYRTHDIPIIVIDYNANDSYTLNTLLEKFKKTFEYINLKDDNKESSIEKLYWSSGKAIYNPITNSLENAVKILSSWVNYALTIGYTK